MAGPEATRLKCVKSRNTPARSAGVESPPPLPERLRQAQHGVGERLERAGFIGFWWCNFRLYPSE
jgi:hypothetical protein